MNRPPKDFDVATDAHPMELRRLFRNSRIIGRRFRLVHVLFQDMTVEVSTFRREPERAAQTEDTENLLITDDNTFGSPLQDAKRRDFTINALFYNIADFSGIDYIGGLLEPLLPDVFRSIGEDRAPYFWKMLEVLDRTVQAGRKISDPVLLSVLFLPWLIQELEAEEGRHGGRMRIAEVVVFLRELIQP